MNTNKSKGKKSSQVEWLTKTLRIGDLKFAAYNPRKISTARLELLKQSIDEFSLTEIPVCNTDLTIIAGHQRVEVALKLFGQDMEIDVRMPKKKLTVGDEKEYNIRSNKNKGEFDTVLLSQFIDFKTLEEMGIGHIAGASKKQQQKQQAGAEALNEEFLKNTIKQIVFTYQNKEFEELYPKLLKLQKLTKTEDMSNLLIKLLDYYEETTVVE